MNHTEITSILSETTNIEKKEIDNIVDCLVSNIVFNLNNKQSVKISGLGVFYLNEKSGKPKFSPSKKLISRMKNGSKT